jgi:hypothetical protein
MEKFYFVQEIAFPGIGLEIMHGNVRYFTENLWQAKGSCIQNSESVFVK